MKWILLRVFLIFIVPLCFCVNTWVSGFVLFFYVTVSLCWAQEPRSDSLFYMLHVHLEKRKRKKKKTKQPGIGSRFLKCESVADCRKEVSQRQSDAGEKLQGEKKQPDHL